MNKLHVTLLLSILLLPKVAICADENSGKGSPSVVETEQVEVKSEKVEVAKNDASKTDVSTMESKAKSSESADADAPNKNVNLLGKVATVAWAPVKFGGNSIDWVANKIFLTSAIKKLANSGFLKEKCVGKFLANHEQNLGRAVIMLAVGGVAYYCWKKCHKCNETEDESLRGYDVFEDDNAEIVFG
jgi:hypothetical protein